MNFTIDDATAFWEKVNLLHNRHKLKFQQDLERMRENCAVTREILQSDALYKRWLTDFEPSARGWHALWCIASDATLFRMADITEEVLKEAQILLDEALKAQEASQEAFRANYHKKDRPS